MVNPLPNPIKIGKLGELIAQLRLLELDVQAAPPLSDTGNDLIGVKGRVMKSIQIKTTTNKSREKCTRKCDLIIYVDLKLDDDQFIDWRETKLSIRKENDTDGSSELSLNMSAVNQYWG
ncbi:MAG TPA: hypothetical protein PKV72_05345 [Candidatus Peribacteria bacterium]|nr:hypothetical protein [Candidatus Peribacteria bacterium]